jgi:dTDP-4-dehydrorhamnose 3,5-epimerase
MSSIKTINLRYNIDSRGFGLYGLYDDQIPGQVNVTTTKSGVIRAFHKHNQQTDHWVCIKGNIHVIVFREDEFLSKPVALRALTPTNHFYIGEKNPQTLTIPPGYYHGFTPMYGEDATLLYYTDRKYDPDDEIRLDWDVLGENIWKTENK